jgi:hypothetical protein
MLRKFQWTTVLFSSLIFIRLVLSLITYNNSGNKHSSKIFFLSQNAITCKKNIDRFLGNTMFSKKCLFAPIQICDP